MSWKDKLKKVTNAVLPGSWDVAEKLGQGLESAWNDISGKTAIDKQNEYNMRMWQMQNEYNTPANQMQRYLQAGLNPNLIYSQGNSGNASSAPEMQAHQSGFGKALDLAKLVLSLKNMAAQNRNLNAQTSNIDAQTNQHIADTDYKMAIIDFYNKHGYFPGQSNAPVNVVGEVMKAAPIQDIGAGVGRVLGGVVGHFSADVDRDPDRALKMAYEAAYRKGLRGQAREDYVSQFIKIYNLTH